MVLLSSGHQPEGPARVWVRGKLQMAGTKPCPSMVSRWTWKRKSKKPPRRAQHQAILKCSGLHGGPAMGTG